MPKGALPKLLLIACAMVGTIGAATATRSAATVAPSMASGPTISPSLADLAKRLDMSPDKLDTAIRAILSERWKKTAAIGNLPSATVQQGLDRIAVAPADLVLGVSFGPPEGPLSVVANHFGITVPQLFDSLRQGKNLTQIAQQHGKSADSVREALTRAASTQVAWQAAQRGWTADQQRRALLSITHQIERWMVSTPLPAQHLPYNVSV